MKRQFTEFSQKKNAIFTVRALTDLHIHGAFGLDFMSVGDRPEASFKEELIHVSRSLLKNGIGYYAPTLLTAKWPQLERAMQRWAAILTKIHSSRSSWPLDAAVPLGLHLEGPFLQTEYSGAHPTKEILKPSPANTRRLLDAGGGWIRIVTLAPEVAGALNAIRQMVRKGIRVQLGHSSASSEIALAAHRAGAIGLTHLYNAMRTHHRDPGLLALLLFPNVTAEIITDGIHVHPITVFQAARRFRGQLYAVSDCCSVTRAAHNRALFLGDVRVVAKNGAAYVATATGAGAGKASKTLAGAATLLSDHPSRLFSKLRNTAPGPSLDTARLLIDLFNQKNLPLALKPRFFAHFEAKSLKFLGISKARP